MRLAALASLTAGLLLVGACSSEDASSPEDTSRDAGGSTSLNIDTDNGSISYEESEGDSSTSISVGSNDDDKQD